MEAEIKKCAGLHRAESSRTRRWPKPRRMPQLTTTLLQQYGDKWTYSLAINDLYFDFMGPSLAAPARSGDAAPKNISAGDGSESAFQRIRAKQYQTARWPSRCNMQGWQLVDELNRAIAKQPWSGYIAEHPSRDRRQHRLRRRRRRTSSIPTTAIATNTRKSGAEVTLHAAGPWPAALFQEE